MYTIKLQWSRRVSVLLRAGTYREGRKLTPSDAKSMTTFLLQLGRMRLLIGFELHGCVKLHKVILLLRLSRVIFVIYFRIGQPQSIRMYRGLLHYIGQTSRGINIQYNPEVIERTAASPEHWPGPIGAIRGLCWFLGHKVTGCYLYETERS